MGRGEMGKLPILFFGIFFLLLTACTVPPRPVNKVLVTPEYYLGMNLSDERWVISKKTPEFLMEEMAEHLAHDLKSSHPNITRAQIQETAEKRLHANELFIFNPRSHARLVIDFSALRKGESPPSKKTIATSADYAGQGLSNEEGITNVVHQTSKSRIPGATRAYRLDAEFKLHHEPFKLVGLIGFAQPYWFYFYYTDPLKDSADLVSMEKLINSFVLLPAGAK